MANRLNFIVSDKLVIDNGLSNPYTLDPAIDWDAVELTAPLSHLLNVVHPFVATEDFVGILSFNGIVDITNTTPGVNRIETSFLKGGYYFNVRATGVVTVDAPLVADVLGFSVSATPVTDPVVAYAVTAGADGDVILVRGGGK